MSKQPSPNPNPNPFLRSPPSPPPHPNPFHLPPPPPAPLQHPIFPTSPPFLESDHQRLNLLLLNLSLPKLNLHNPSPHDLSDIFKTIQKLAGTNIEFKETVEKLEETKGGLSTKLEESAEKVIELEEKIKKMEFQYHENIEIMMEERIKDMQRMEEVEGRLEKMEEKRREEGMKWRTEFSEGEIERYEELYFRQPRCEPLEKAPQSDKETQTAEEPPKPRTLHLLSQPLLSIQLPPSSHQPTPASPLTTSSSTNTTLDLPLLLLQHQQALSKIQTICSIINRHLLSLDLPSPISTHTILESSNQQQIETTILTYYTQLDDLLDTNRKLFIRQKSLINDNIRRKQQEVDQRDHQNYLFLLEMLQKVKKSLVGMKRYCASQKEINERKKRQIFQPSSPQDQQLTTEDEEVNLWGLEQVQNDIDEVLKRNSYILGSIEGQSELTENQMDPQFMQTIKNSIQEMRQTISCQETNWAETNGQILEIIGEIAEEAEEVKAEIAGSQEPAAETGTESRDQGMGRDDRTSE